MPQLMDCSQAEAVADSADLAFLRGRIQELETEQRLMQRELDSVSEAAQRSDSQLRCLLVVPRPRPRRSHFSG